jgi:hypothetical protein
MQTGHFLVPTCCTRPRATPWRCTPTLHMYVQVCRCRRSSPLKPHRPATTIADSARPWPTYRACNILLLAAPMCCPRHGDFDVGRSPSRLPIDDIEHQGGHMLARYSRPSHGIHAPYASTSRDIRQWARPPDNNVGESLNPMSASQQWFHGTQPGTEPP